MSTTQKSRFDAPIAALPASLRDRVANWVERLLKRGVSLGPDAGFDSNGLVRLFACSDFAANFAVQKCEWFCEEMRSGGLAKTVSRAILQDRFAALSATAADKAGFMREIRRLRNENLLRILWGDLIEGDPLAQTLRSLSDLAESAVNAAVEFATQQLAQRFGHVSHEGRSVPLVVLGMGKLGGRELNFSSDIDLVFLYSAEGETDGEKSISAHEFFTRVARLTASLLDDVTDDGFVYRVDTRLRPFGASGPPVTSFSGLESYLVQHGRGWERYAYVKARIIAPARPDEWLADFMHNSVAPFVYRRYLDYGVFESLREMKALVSAEVRKREMLDNIKLGPGGIREIEFIVQALQLVRGGSVPGLKTPELRMALEHGIDDHTLTADVARRLLAAYEFLRRVENYLQANRDLQTHDLPSSEIGRDRLAYAMRFDSWAELEEALIAQRAYVSERFSEIAFRAGEEDSDTGDTGEVKALWSGGASADDWHHYFNSGEFEDAAELGRMMASFAATPSVRRVDKIAAQRLRQFVPAMLRLLMSRPRPAIMLQRVLNIVDRVLRRSAYLALLNENPNVLARLIDLCATSGYLAGEIARFPVLLDELIDARRYALAPDIGEIRIEMEQRTALVDPADSERQLEVLAEFKRAAQFRLAVADFSGSISVMKVSDRLTDIAEMILSRALWLAHADMVERFGEPCFRFQGRLHKAGLGVIAYGKLGGMELSYGSDLDLVFLHDSRGRDQQTTGSKPIDNDVFFGRLARRLVHYLTTQTGSGALYEIDTRLRPSGRAGLLVTSIDGFERYQEENAWTWEHQALLRSRAVVGSSVVSREFERIRAHTLRNRVRWDRLRDDVVSMRTKMRKQLDKSSATRFDLKQGSGGVADIEFLVQFLVLSNAAAHPAVIHYSDNIRQLGTLAAANCLSEDECRRLQDIYRDYRVRTHQLALDDQPAFADADDFAEQRQYVRRLWQRELGENA